MTPCATWREGAVSKYRWDVDRWIFRRCSESSKNGDTAAASRSVVMTPQKRARTSNSPFSISPTFALEPCRGPLSSASHCCYHEASRKIAESGDRVVASLVRNDVMVRPISLSQLCILGILNLALLASALGVNRAHAQDDASATADEESTEASERRQRFDALTKQLTRSKWTGRFSMDGQAEGELRDETYEIASVTKLPIGDLWTFNARIKYGDHDVTVPLPIKVSWAGNTPMIVVDRLTIPGMGTFDARVLISGDRYAGTWQHGEVGGHLFGTIASSDAETETAETEE